jgi:hypothetical protein
MSRLRTNRAGFIGVVDNHQSAVAGISSFMPIFIHLLDYKIVDDPLAWKNHI